MTPARAGASPVFIRDGAHSPRRVGDGSTPSLDLVNTHRTSLPPVRSRIMNVLQEDLARARMEDRVRSSERRGRVARLAALRRWERRAHSALRRSSDLRSAVR
jgi:hypothetical protein